MTEAGGRAFLAAKGARAWQLCWEEAWWPARVGLWPVASWLLQAVQGCMAMGVSESNCVLGG